ncbi:MAG: succinylglutamate desuccinylase/aspartoacylase family protein, partial [Bacteroidota bacterium]
MPDLIQIGDQSIKRGKSVTIDLAIAKLPSNTPIDLKVHVYRAKKDGPVLLLTGALHGDEINGVEIIRRLIKSKKIEPESGTVIAIPIVNLYGFNLNVRGVPDGKDINRSFPGVKGGSLARLVAYTVMNEILPVIDYGIDFHTGGASRSNYPQIRCSFNVSRSKELAAAFSAPITLHSTLIPKSFRHAANKRGRHILVYEAGESLRLYEAGIREGINGTLRLMRYLGMKNGTLESNSGKSYRKSIWIRAKRSGLFIQNSMLGLETERGTLLGEISDPYGSRSHHLSAPHKGTVIGMNFSPVVH